MELPFFARLWNYFRFPIPCSAYVTAPLDKKLSSRGELKTFYRWTDNNKTRLRTVKARLILSGIFPLTFARHLYHGNRGMWQVGWMCPPATQSAGTHRPIEYWSLSWIDTERAYEMTKCICLALLWTVLLLWRYSEGCHFAVRTDKIILKWALNIADWTDNQEHWPQLLSEPQARNKA